MTEEERLYNLLQPFVVTMHRKLSAMEPEPEGFIAGFKKVLAGEPALLDYAKAEVAHLSAMGMRQLSVYDYESKIRCEAIKALIEESERTDT